MIVKFPTNLLSHDISQLQSSKSTTYSNLLTYLEKWDESKVATVLSFRLETLETEEEWFCYVILFDIGLNKVS